MIANIWIRKMLPLCWTIALVGCNQSEPHFKIDAIEALPVGGFLETPASELVSSDIAYICSFGPYADARFMDDKKMSNMAGKSGLLPVPETKGYFLYFDNEGALLQSDRFEQWDGKNRWGHSADNSNAKCLELATSSIRVSNKRDYYRFSLETL